MIIRVIRNQRRERLTKGTANRNRTTPTRDTDRSPRLWGSRCLALLLLVMTFPVIGFLLLLVRLTSRGPGIYTQRRVGIRGREFTLYKLRSMRDDAELRTGPVWASKNDPRVTTVGRMLRGTHLDELPQLLNVVRGEMAFVGPRPERPEIVAQLTAAIPGYEKRLLVHAGITGLAQVCATPDFDLESARRKLSFDLAYLSASGNTVLLDVRIALATLLRMASVERSKAVAWTGLHVIQPVALERPQAEPSERRIAA